MRRTRWVSMLAAAGALLLSASCSDPGGGGPTAPPPVLIASPTPSPTPSATPTPTPEDKAEAAVVRFWKVVDELAADPDKDLNGLHVVARDPMFAQWVVNINQYRYDRLHQVGRVKVDDPTAKKTDRKELYSVTACIDVGAADLVNEDGKSVVKKDRPRRVAYTYTVQLDGGKGYLVDEAVKGTC